MRWTIGMPCYDNYTEVWFTVNALRMYHDLSDAEILIIDNFGDVSLQRFCERDRAGGLRYIRHREAVGVSTAKNRIFREARGQYVMVIDSHIMLAPGALDIDIPGGDMVQGPLRAADGVGLKCEWLPQWRRGMWGVWADAVPEDALPAKPWRIWAQGAGCFAVRRDAWLGFNERFRGFGGETGYIQEKYRRHGRSVWCDPRLQWSHFFNAGVFGRRIPYPCERVDRVRNYLIGFDELGMDTAPIVREFGKELVAEAKARG